MRCLSPTTLGQSRTVFRSKGDRIELAVNKDRNYNNVVLVTRIRTSVCAFFIIASSAEIIPARSNLDENTLGSRIRARLASKKRLRRR